MPIRLKIPPDPFAEASWDTDTIVIESSASRQLENELRRYCRREVDGRSFLIAGHRGAGKTTLVNHALLKLLKESETGDYPSRPLIVRLHGPNLLRAEDPAPKPAAGNGAGGAAEVNPARRQQQPAEASQTKVGEQLAGLDLLAQREQAQNHESDPDLRRVQVALQQITLSLYRALASEITHHYRASVHERALPPVEKLDLLERAAQLELDLDQFPTPDRLREHWRAGRFLDTGVLFGHGRRPPGQGFAELVALASACHAYGRVSGTFEKAELKQSLNASAASTVSIDQKGQDLFAPLISIFTGGLAGAAAYVAPAQGQPVVSTFAGILAALGASAVFKYSASRTRTRTYSTEFTFLPDLRVATLDRALPVLIDRMTTAGLVPVFVVDELDKVEGLYQDLEKIVRHVKNLVAERAFFCFLADRSYYERVVHVDVRDPYPKHYTYFTDRVFVSFQASDIHGYLRRVLTRESAAPVATAALATPGQSAVPPSLAPATESTEDAEDGADLEVLPYVLLRRSEMHTIALRRQLSGIRGDDNLLQLERGRVRLEARYRRDVLVQFAIELILHRPRMLDRLRDDPAFSRLAHDALYYPLRKLHAAPDEDGDVEATRGLVDLSDEKLGEFRQYLTDRMSSDPEPAAARKQNGTHAQPANDSAGESRNAAELKEPPLSVSDADPALLYEDVRDLAELLASPWALLDELAAAADRGAYPKAVLDALPLNDSAGPLLAGNRDGQRIYHWRYDRDWNLRVEHERRPQAYQLEQYVELAIRVLLQECDASADVPMTDELRRQLRAALWLPLEEWRAGSDSVTVNAHYAAALRSVAPLMADAKVDKLVRSHVTTLGQRLSDHAQYFAALNTSGLRSRYDRLLSLFEPLQPLVERHGNEWRFVYDAAGRQLRAATETGSWTAARVDWQRDVDLVRGVAAAIASFHQNGARLSPALLANLGVLPTSPSWSAVESALSRLERFRLDRRQYSDFEQDAQGVADYAKLLLTHRQSIGSALLVGAVLGRGAPPSNEPATAVALRELAHAYRVGAADAEPVAETLARTQSSLVHRYPILAPLAAVMPADEMSVDSWSKWIAQLTALIANLGPLSDAERTAALAAAWEEWLTYFRGSFPAGQRFEAGVDDLLCRAGNIGPCRLLEDDAPKMTIARWSDALFACAIGDSYAQPPNWLAERVASALGIARTHGLDHALIVRAPNDSLTSAWLPAGSFRGIAWTPEQIARIEQLADPQAPALAHLEGTRFVFIEQGVAESTVRAATAIAARYGKRQDVVVMMFAPADVAAKPAWAQTVIVRPAAPEELFRVV